MALLLLGLFLFYGAHLLASVLAPRLRSWRERRGEGPVKGVIALAILAGLVLIVLGWRSAVPQGIYAPPPELRLPALVLLVIAVWLFAVASRPSALKRVLRHPQLTGLLLWCIAHLMVNGDSRSLLLFGSMGVWSVAEMLLINRRDGAYTPPAMPGLGADIVTAVIAVALFLLLVLVHPWLAGVPVLPH